ncbi:RloB family protein [Arthrobacter dokdonensis]|uniref:RloB family protein n=1 Tax=Arthrobacter dokdonellae TaxID=2211210 RepID=UPI000DE5A109|nr:RloB family protein [Arthrobacter dokdonellae]
MTAKGRANQRGKRLRRTTETKPVRITFRIYSEGESTEPEYIDALKRLPEFAETIAVDIAIEEVGATPMHLVESACAAKHRVDLDIDFYWCVFDVEHPKPHPYLDRATNMARDNDVSLAISNPCFELWLILHYRDQTAHLSTDEAIRLRKGLDGSDGKHLDGATYMAARRDAIRRAQSLRKKHLGDGTKFPHDNPSSSFDELVTLIDAKVKAAGGGRVHRDAD